MRYAILFMLLLTACDSRASFNIKKYTEVYNACLQGYKDTDIRIESTDIQRCSSLAVDAARRPDREEK